MKKIKLITDSSCDLPMDIINKENISIVNLNIQFEDETYIDGIDIDNTTFYKKMKETDVLPKTASPSPSTFLKEFECEEEEIIVMCLSSKLSSTYNNALIAKNMYNDEVGTKDIRVIDSLNGSMALGLLLLKASHLINEGYDIDYITDAIEQQKKQIRNYVVLDTIENAVKAGRISSIKGAMAQALNLKIIVAVEDGLVNVIDRARGDKKSFAKIIKFIEDAKIDTSERVIGICHADCLDKALQMKDMISKQFNFKEIVVSQIGSAIGTYSSTGALLVTF